jgi:hypothetical protein
MAEINLIGGWLAILIGLVGGAAIGLFFHRDQWLGGYSSWSRRMLRLAHISLVGTGLLNILFALSAYRVRDPFSQQVASWLFLCGAISMPTVCALSAWRHGGRHFFFIPVLCLVCATVALLWGILVS